MRSIASGKFCLSALCSRGRRKAPARATGSPQSTDGSPDKCTVSPLGNSVSLHSTPGGGAKRLPGLRAHRSLRNGSPDRCAASPPGNSVSLHSAPGAAQIACPGYGLTAVYGTVARTDAQHRLREILSLCTLLPGAAQSACPGYGLTAVYGTVARIDAQHRLREILSLCTLLPGAAQSACPGYGLTAVYGTVARTDAQHRLREILSLCTLLPGAAQSACPGYGLTAVYGTVARTDAQHRLRENYRAILFRSPGKASAATRVFSALTYCASRPENAPVAGQSLHLQNAPAAISPPPLRRSPR